MPVLGAVANLNGLKGEIPRSNLGVLKSQTSDAQVILLMGHYFRLRALHRRRAACDEVGRCRDTLAIDSRRRFGIPCGTTCRQTSVG